MVVPLMDVTRTKVYINPDYVISVRPDPADPDHISIVRLRDETVRVLEDHEKAADRLARAAA
jgi:hypothetical protein